MICLGLADDLAGFDQVQVQFLPGFGIHGDPDPTGEGNRSGIAVGGRLCGRSADLVVESF